MVNSSNYQNLIPRQSARDRALQTQAALQGELRQRENIAQRDAIAAPADVSLDEYDADSGLIIGSTANGSQLYLAPGSNASPTGSVRIERDRSNATPAITGKPYTETLSGLNRSTDIQARRAARNAGALVYDSANPLVTPPVHGRIEGDKRLDLNGRILSIWDGTNQQWVTVATGSISAQVVIEGVQDRLYKGYYATQYATRFTGLDKSPDTVANATVQRAGSAIAVGTLISIGDLLELSVTNSDGNEAFFIINMELA